MKTIGVIGLGDMGSGLAKNLIANGFTTHGLDLSAERMAAFKDMGGTPAATPAEMGKHCDAVFVMVMNGDQARDVILGPDGLCRTMAKGGCRPFDRHHQAHRSATDRSRHGRHRHPPDR